MNILVFNCGSSSLNYKVYYFDNTQIHLVNHGKAHRVGTKGNEPSFIEHHIKGSDERITTPIENHQQAAQHILDHLIRANQPFDIIGHRFVHGGDRFQQSTILTPQKLDALKTCLPLAPIHNPNSLSVIETCQNVFPKKPQYVTFDTSFHASLPESAYTYLLPFSIIKKYGFRKYGFHGLSYQYVTLEIAKHLNQPPEKLDLIVCHLGTGGASITAIQKGKSIDTSMGYSPLPGLVMSTRTGDLDPLLPPFLSSMFHLNPEQLTDIFNKKSGLLGIAGFSSDLRDILKKVEEDKDQRAVLAWEIYVHRVRKYIGCYAALLNGFGALVFTDDIGAQNWQLRQSVCQNMTWCGIALDIEKNKAAASHQLNRLDAPESSVKIFSMPTDEEKMIALEGIKLFPPLGDRSC
ncbi:MAG: acetate/propionate family kinase [Anaerolineae bacterium]|nr:acetate/propionate family kinase [Anaerolineae bacterium]